MTRDCIDRSSNNNRAIDVKDTQYKSMLPVKDEKGLKKAYCNKHI